MNKLTVREVSKDSAFGFELERKTDGSSSSSVSRVAAAAAGSRGFAARDAADGASSSSSPSAIVVNCDSESDRDDWLRTINGQIRDLKDIAKRLENPQFM